MAQQQPAHAVTAREDLGTILTGCWMLAGAGLDGRAHVTQQLESFFTPWHAILYTGFGATVAWMALIVRRRHAPGTSFASSIPTGYRLAWIGLATFTVGGLGDLLWHEIFGIEQGIAATFSPTHLLLFFGAILILTSPLRSAWSRTGPVAPVSAIAATVLAVTITSLAMTYLSPFVFQDAVVNEPEFSRVYQRTGIASILMTNVLMVAPPLALLARWRLPFGSFSALWSIPVLAVVLTNVPGDYAFILGTFGASIMCDVAARFLQPSVAEPGRLRLLAIAAPLFLWGAYFATLAHMHVLEWEPDLWGGTLVWASASALGITELLLVGTRAQARVTVSALAESSRGHANVD